MRLDASPQPSHSEVPPAGALQGALLATTSRSERCTRCRLSGMRESSRAEEEKRTAHRVCVQYNESIDAGVRAGKARTKFREHARKRALQLPLHDGAG